MKKTVLWVILISVASCIYAQNNYTYDQIQILKDDTLYRGIYLTHDDFVKNSPSYTDLPITTREKSYVYSEHYFVDGLNVWKVVNGTKKNQKIIDDGNYWGWCDGASVYYDAYKLISLGRYCIYESVNIYRPTGAYNNNGTWHSSASMIAVSRVYQYAMDILTGIVYEMTDENIEVLVSDFPDLHQDFLSLKRKDRALKYVWYINQINDSY